MRENEREIIPNSVAVAGFKGRKQTCVRSVNTLLFHFNTVHRLALRFAVLRQACIADDPDSSHALDLHHSPHLDWSKILNRNYIMFNLVQDEGAICNQKRTPSHIFRGKGHRTIASLPTHR